MALNKVWVFPEQLKDSLLHKLIKEACAIRTLQTRWDKGRRRVPWNSHPSSLILSVDDSSSWTTKPLLWRALTPFSESASTRVRSVPSTTKLSTYLLRPTPNFLMPRGQPPALSPIPDLAEPEWSWRHCWELKALQCKHQNQVLRWQCCTLRAKPEGQARHTQAARIDRWDSFLRSLNSVNWCLAKSPMCGGEFPGLRPCSDGNWFLPKPGKHHRDDSHQDSKNPDCRKIETEFQWPREVRPLKHRRWSIDWWSVGISRTHSLIAALTALWITLSMMACRSWKKPPITRKLDIVTKCPAMAPTITRDHTASPMATCLTSLTLEM